MMAALLAAFLVVFSLAVSSVEAQRRPPSCPPPVPGTRCRVNTCLARHCGIFRFAKCRVNPRTCKPKWTIRKIDVTRLCSKVGPCRFPVREVRCRPNPCKSISCPAYRCATCVSDPCDNCNPRFFLGKREVTRRCGRRPIPS